MGAEDTTGPVEDQLGTLLDQLETLLDQLLYSVSDHDRMVTLTSKSENLILSFVGTF